MGMADYVLRISIFGNFKFKSTYINITAQSPEMRFLYTVDSSQLGNLTDKEQKRTELIFHWYYNQTSKYHATMDNDVYKYLTDATRGKTCDGFDQYNDMTKHVLHRSHLLITLRKNMI